MTTILTRPLRLEDRPDIETLLHASGEQVWPRDEIDDQWQSAQGAIKPRLFYRLVNRYAILGFCCLRIGLFRGLYNRSSPGVWITTDVLDEKPEQYAYWRGLRLTPLPLVVSETINRIRGLVPEARFKISYLQRDPVLWLCVYDPKIASERQIAVLVWDEVGRRREPKIILPPSVLPGWVRNA